MQLWQKLLAVRLNIVTLVVLIGGAIFAGYAKPPGLLIVGGKEGCVLEIKENDFF